VSLLRDEVRFTDREGSHGQSRTKLAAVCGAGHVFRDPISLNLQTERLKLSVDRDEGVRIRQTVYGRLASNLWKWLFVLWRLSPHLLKERRGGKSIRRNPGMRTFYDTAARHNGANRGLTPIRAKCHSAVLAGEP